MRISDWSSDVCSSDLQAAGLTIADLFPGRLAADTHEDRQRRRRLAREAQWGAALEGVPHEARVVAIAAGDIAYRRPASVEDSTRPCEARAAAHRARKECVSKCKVMGTLEHQKKQKN